MFFIVSIQFIEVKPMKKPNPFKPIKPLIFVHPKTNFTRKKLGFSGNVVYKLLKPNSDKVIDSINVSNEPVTNRRYSLNPIRDKSTSRGRNRGFTISRDYLLELLDKYIASNNLKMISEIVKLIK